MCQRSPVFVNLFFDGRQTGLGLGDLDRQGYPLNIPQLRSG